MNAFEFQELLRVAGGMLGALLLTIAVELPVIRFGKITKNVRLIIAVNAATNLTFNCVCLLTYHLGQLPETIGTYAEGLTYGWIALSELFWIPLSEAWTYAKISKASKRRVYAVTYLANAASFLAGILFQWIVTGTLV